MILEKPDFFFTKKLLALLRPMATEVSNDPAGPLAREDDVAAADGPLWTARWAQTNRYYSGPEWA